MDLTGLEGKVFDLETQNCYNAVQAFYRLNFGIELRDYPCPGHWWEQGLDLYRDLAGQEGFQLVQDPPSRWQAGDVILMAIDASVANHCAVLLPNGKIYHHLYGQLSCVTSYGGLFRNTTVAVYRHPDVQVHQRPKERVELESLLPPHVRRRLEISRTGEAPEGPAGAGA